MFGPRRIKLAHMKKKGESAKKLIKSQNEKKK